MQNMEVYIDYMLIKSKVIEAHIDVFQKTFTTLWKYQMKLNLAKYAFGASSNKLLGFMVSNKGVEANPNKIKAICDMSLSKMIKDVECHTRRIAILSRFVSKLAEQCLSFC